MRIMEASQLCRLRPRTSRRQWMDAKVSEVKSTWIFVLLIRTDLTSKAFRCDTCFATVHRLPARLPPNTSHTCLDSPPAKNYRPLAAKTSLTACYSIMLYINFIQTRLYFAYIVVFVLSILYALLPTLRLTKYLLKSCTTTITLTTAHKEQDVCTRYIHVVRWRPLIAAAYQWMATHSVCRPAEW